MVIVRTAKGTATEAEAEIEALTAAGVSAASGWENGLATLTSIVAATPTEQTDFEE